MDADLHISSPFEPNEIDEFIELLNNIFPKEGDEVNNEYARRERDEHGVHYSAESVTKDEKRILEELTNGPTDCNASMYDVQNFNNDEMEISAINEEPDFRSLSQKNQARHGGVVRSDGNYINNTAESSTDNDPVSVHFPDPFSNEYVHLGSHSLIDSMDSPAIVGEISASFESNILNIEPNSEIHIMNSTNCLQTSCFDNHIIKPANEDLGNVVFQSEDGEDLAQFLIDPTNAIMDDVRTPGENGIQSKLSSVENSFQHFCHGTDGQHLHVILPHENHISQNTTGTAVDGPISENFPVLLPNEENNLGVQNLIGAMDSKPQASAFAASMDQKVEHIDHDSATHKTESCSSDSQPMLSEFQMEEKNYVHTTKEVLDQGEAVRQSITGKQQNNAAPSPPLLSQSPQGHQGLKKTIIEPGRFPSQCFTYETPQTLVFNTQVCVQKAAELFYKIVYERFQMVRGHQKQHPYGKGCHRILGPVEENRAGLKTRNNIESYLRKEILGKMEPSDELVSIYANAFLDAGKFVVLCPSCDTLFRDKSQFNQHIIRLSDERLMCPYLCGRKLTTFKTLLSHIRTSHRLKRGRNANLPDFKCEVEGCGRTFRTFRGLSNHCEDQHNAWC